MLLEKIRSFQRRFPNGYAQMIHAQSFADEIINFLFPVRWGSELTVDLLAQREPLLKAKLEALLEASNSNPAIAENFFEELPDIFDKLTRDAEAILTFDPAANSLEEVVIAYPGFYAIAVQRLAHILYQHHVVILPRILTEYAHSKTGIDIHPGAQIGDSFFIDHGTGVVIGETAVIGHNVKIYQGVTLGALTVEKGTTHGQRHPTIEDNVIIYSGSTILGGKTVVGHDSVIGGNVWLTESVPPLSVVYQKSEVKIRDRSEMKSVIEFMI
ncbi:MAG: serine O-acetyltransferase [Bacteroidetes bacterium]|nr:serine O-acetyltransferase [Bacteroidota bacterium]